MKKTLIFFVILNFTVQFGYGQILSKKAYRFENEPAPELKSNGISDIVVVDENTIWLATGRGLSKTEDGGLTWKTYAEEQGIGKGGISALAVKDSVIWVATVNNVVALQVISVAKIGIALALLIGQGGWK